MGENLTKTLIRFGFIIRGILYLLTGFYGLEAAIGVGHGAKDITEIIKTLGQIPFGKIILLIIFIGLVGYGLGGFVRLWFGKRKLLTRLGYGASGLAYLSVALIPLRLLMNLASPGASSSKKYASTLAGLPGGYLILTLIGLATVFAGFGQIKYGYKEKFRRNLKKLGSDEEKEAVDLTGKYGYSARGVIITLIGLSLLLAGLTGNIFRIKDPTEILLWILQQREGPILLGIISGGLMALGAYSVIVSRKVKINIDEKN